MPDYMLLANAFSLLSAIMLVASSFASTKKWLLYMQTADALFAGIACIVCGSYAAASVDLLSSARNVLTARGVARRWVCAVFCVVLVTIGIAINNKGIIGCLTIAASLEYTVVMMTTSDVCLTRLALMANIACWLIHDVYMVLVPSACVDVVVLVVTTVKLVQELIARRHTAVDAES